MLKKTITSQGLEGPVQDEYFFHLSKKDIVEMQLYDEGQDFEARMRAIVESQDTRKIYDEFKKIMLLAVGVKSDDGKRLLKTAKVREEFESSDAFSEFLLELLNDADNAAKFIAAIVPEGFAVNSANSGPTQADFDRWRAKADEASTTEPPVDPPRVLTREELISMDHDELTSGLATGKFTLES